MEQIAQGAEAKIFAMGDIIIKQRVSKGYRHPQIDAQLTKSRNRCEAKILSKLHEAGFPTAMLIELDEKGHQIKMERLKGRTLAAMLEEDHIALGAEIGEKLAKMHSLEVIHGDPTTSNMIKLDEVHFIDFGLSQISDKVEHKAVDLHLLERSLESKHHTVAKECFEEILSAYKKHAADADAVFERFEAVKKRGRYKNH